MTLFYIQFIDFFANPWWVGGEIIFVSIILFVLAPKPKRSLSNNFMSHIEYPDFQ
ncbi:hypothetical protein GMMP1_650019 [Candidatus Magnetomoraceae bacterium gMMP-1]